MYIIIIIIIIIIINTYHTYQLLYDSLSNVTHSFVEL